MNINSAFALLGSSRESFDSFHEYLDQMYLNPDASLINKEIANWYKDENHSQVEWEEFRNWFHIERHPTISEKKHKLYDSIIDRISEAEVDTSSVSRLYELAVADSIKAECDDIKKESGSNSLINVIDLAQTFLDAGIHESNDYLINMDVEHLVSSVIKGDGIEWRLEALNTSVGQLHQSDFVIVGKRPETGGTSFIVSEFTHMLHQLPEGKSAIIFNNEEGGEKIGLRVIQSALGVTSKQIEEDPVNNQKLYEAFLDGRQFYICDKPGMTTRDIERVLKKYPDCWLIGINVLDKIGGFYKESEVDRFRKLAEWGRNTAKQYGTVIAIAQADATAEGVQYLDQSQLYGSKTGVQGEADVMIMIGRDVAVHDKRYFSIAKNKKPTTGRMITHQRHAKFECKFDEDTGRFT